MMWETYRGNRQKDGGQKNEDLMVLAYWKPEKYGKMIMRQNDRDAGTLQFYLTPLPLRFTISPISNLQFRLFPH